jgi:hypothetical protein
MVHGLTLAPVTIDQAAVGVVNKPVEYTLYLQHMHSFVSTIETVYPFPHLFPP